MPAMTESEYKNALRAGRGGVYVLFGEEDYLIEYYRDRARQPYLEDAAESFNYVKIPYSSAENAEEIVSFVMSPPMMSLTGRRLAEVSIDDMKSLDSAAVDALADALSAAAEFDDNIVILPLSSGTFDYGTLPKRPSALYKKLIERDGVNMVYFPETTPAQLRRWIERHLEHAGVMFEYDTAERIMSVSGRKMIVLAQEIDKLISYVKSSGRDRVTAQDVGEVCSVSDRYDAFELSNAILDGRREDALDALMAERTRHTDPIILSAGIMRVISDILSVKMMQDKGVGAREISSKLGMHEYKTKLYMNSASRRSRESIESAVLACAEADKKLKSSTLGYAALERLICSL